MKYEKDIKNNLSFVDISYVYKIDPNILLLMLFCNIDKLTDLLTIYLYERYLFQILTQ